MNITRCLEAEAAIEVAGGATNLTGFAEVVFSVEAPRRHIERAAVRGKM
ncbi:hypothetical protein [Nannocystis pusilla]|uniref:Uncharacterized protein n=1 Tax=Nannocystis pusilla TaxID=889268 RepID=A0ABS7TSE2_9BACT|nr:hypothetical protein [Nannocystis pusilla]MBZ5711138.1 hypothetical protein [Nannocystis pusilla]